jgi:hypothetical protein
MAIVMQEETTAKIKQMVCDVLAQDGMAVQDSELVSLQDKACRCFYTVCQINDYLTDSQVKAIIRQVITERGEL